MIEHNNRDIADKHAEYITSTELRRYTADKVAKYCGQNITVFDPTAGSGQLAQFINPTRLVAVELQQKACDALKQNYPTADVRCESFFNYQSDEVCDAVVMNPPFSLKFKELSDVEKQNIQTEFAWKKSGVTDEIFVLKSLKHTKRFGFYILFAGLAYRKSEQKFRDLLGDKLAELNRIKNGFDDTQIEVLFLIVDKQKKDKLTHRELYDCKQQKVLAQDKVQLDDIWQTVVVEQPQEIIDIDKVNQELIDTAIKNLKNELDKNIFLMQVLSAKIDVTGIIKRIRKICDECELQLGVNNAN